MSGLRGATLGCAVSRISASRSLRPKCTMHVCHAGFLASRSGSSNGTLSTHWRSGMLGITRSVKCAAVPHMRRALHEGHTPRCFLALERQLFLQSRGRVGWSGTATSGRSESVGFSGRVVMGNCRRELSSHDCPDAARANFRNFATPL
jgi:hypothetical protein